MNTERYDVIVIGGGPAGSTAALRLARAGHKVCVLEKDRHPRFHIGESILPRNMPLIEELGLGPALRALPHVPKFGAEFGFGDNFDTRRFRFTDGLLPGFPVFNIERSLFDAMLIEQSRVAGAVVFENRPAGARVMVKGARPLLRLAVTNPLTPVSAATRSRPTATPASTGRAIYSRRPVARTASA